MNIILNQSLDLSNLVSRSGKFSVNEYQEIIKDIIMNYKDYADSSKECIITITKAMEVVEGKQILDVEVLLPILYNIQVKIPYVFKEKIKITNALYTKIEQVEKLDEAMDKVNQYITSNGLQPITSAYVVQTKQAGKHMFEIYIGLNSIIL